VDGKRANHAWVWHYDLSAVIILAGVILAVLVTTAFGGTLGTVVKTVAIVLGLVVAGLTAIKDFFNYAGSARGTIGALRSCSKQNGGPSASGTGLSQGRPTPRIMRIFAAGSKMFSVWTSRPVSPRSSKRRSISRTALPERAPGSHNAKCSSGTLHVVALGQNN